MNIKDMKTQWRLLPELEAQDGLCRRRIKPDDREDLAGRDLRRRIISGGRLDQNNFRLRRSSSPHIRAPFRLDQRLEGIGDEGRIHQPGGNGIAADLWC